MAPSLLALFLLLTALWDSRSCSPRATARNPSSPCLGQQRGLQAPTAWEGQHPKAFWGLGSSFWLQFAELVAAAQGKCPTGAVRHCLRRGWGTRTWTGSSPHESGADFFPVSRGIQPEALQRVTGHFLRKTDTEQEHQRMWEKFMAVPCSWIHQSQFCQATTRVSPHGRAQRDSSTHSSLGTSLHQHAEFPFSLNVGTAFPEYLPIQDCIEVTAIFCEPQPRAIKCTGRTHRAQHTWLSFSINLAHFTGPTLK